jgi:hypothetical protein
MNRSTIFLSFYRLTIPHHWILQNTRVKSKQPISSTPQNKTTMNLFYVIAASIFLFARSSEGFTVSSGQPSKPSSSQLYDKTTGSKLDDAIDNAKTEMNNVRKAKGERRK